MLERQRRQDTDDEDRVFAEEIANGSDLDLLCIQVHRAFLLDWKSTMITLPELLALWRRPFIVASLARRHGDHAAGGAHLVATRRFYLHGVAVLLAFAGFQRFRRRTATTAAFATTSALTTTTATSTTLFTRRLRTLLLLCLLRVGKRRHAQQGDQEGCFHRILHQVVSVHPDCPPIVEQI
jgi:hypothetical protein